MDKERDKVLRDEQESDVLLRIAGDTAKFGGWSVDLSTNKVSWSDQVARIHEMPIGYSPMVSEGIRFYAPEWREKINAVFTACAEKGIPYDEEMEIITGRGRRVWVRTIGEAVKDDENRIVKVQGSFQDISEQKRNELVLYESERRIKTLMSNLPGMVYTCKLDRNWTMEFVSLGCIALTGYKPADLINNKRLSYKELIFPDDRKMVRNTITEAVDRGEPFTLEYRMIDAAGREKWAWERGQAIPCEPGEEQLLEGFILDITGRKKAEAEVRALNEEMEQRVRERTAEYKAINKELESFAYSVSHDFRTPLRAIDGFSEYLINGYSNQLDDMGKHYLKRIRKAALYMSNLIDDLLKLSRVSRADLNRARVDLRKIAAEVLESFSETEQARQVEVTIEPILITRGDPHLLRIVIENLLGNAIKFSAREEKPEIEVGMIEQAEEKAFYVRDNGVGFNMAYADKLFGAFQRLHGADDFSGNGIGLATVQRIINLHGGRIWAESEVGKGATFYFTLPE